MPEETKKNCEEISKYLVGSLLLLVSALRRAFRHGPSVVELRTPPCQSARWDPKDKVKRKRARTN